MKKQSIPEDVTVKKLEEAGWKATEGFSLEDMVEAAADYCNEVIVRESVKKGKMLAIVYRHPYKMFVGFLEREFTKKEAEEAAFLEMQKAYKEAVVAVEKYVEEFGTADGGHRALIRTALDIAGYCPEKYSDDEIDAMVDHGKCYCHITPM